MNPQEPDNSDGDWVKRYRQASDAEAASPSLKTREAILAEGRRVAAQRAADPTSHRFDTDQPAANQPRWKLAAAGTVGAALLAAVLMFPHLGAPPNASLAEVASPSVASSAAVRQSAAEPSSEALADVTVTGARRAAAAPAATRARKAESPASSDAPALDRSEDAAPRESKQANTGFLAGAQAARPSPSATPSTESAPSPRAASALAGRTVRSNLADDSLSSSVQSGDLARLRALLNEGVNPEQRDEQGRTSLLLAVIAHRDDMVELLLAHHADPNAADQAGETPLQIARHAGLPNIIKLLERAGAR